MLNPLSSYYIYQHPQEWMRLHDIYRKVNSTFGLKPYATKQEIENYEQGRLLLVDYYILALDAWRSDEEDAWVQEVVALFTSLGLTEYNPPVPRSTEPRIKT